ncbi:hypothetical protein HDU96_000203 [Phlyctochytrium bullatum]|nr:hypothetical protein HDU96_000203 [Phlyctochytrium bullatum]
MGNFAQTCITVGAIQLALTSQWASLAVNCVILPASQLLMVGMWDPLVNNETGWYVRQYSLSTIQFPLKLICFTYPYNKKEIIPWFLVIFQLAAERFLPRIMDRISAKLRNQVSPGDPEPQPPSVSLQPASSIPKLSTRAAEDDLPTYNDLQRRPSDLNPDAAKPTEVFAHTVDLRTPSSVRFTARPSTVSETKLAETRESKQKDETGGNPAVRLPAVSIHEATSNEALAETSGVDRGAAEGLSHKLTVTTLKASPAIKFIDETHPADPSLSKPAVMTELTSGAAPPAPRELTSGSPSPRELTPGPLSPRERDFDVASIAVSEVASTMAMTEGTLRRLKRKATTVVFAMSSAVEAAYAMSRNDLMFANYMSTLSGLACAVLPNPFNHWRSSATYFNPGKDPSLDGEGLMTPLPGWRDKLVIGMAFLGVQIVTECALVVWEAKRGVPIGQVRTTYPIFYFNLANKHFMNALCAYCATEGMFVA